MSTNRGDMPAMPQSVAQSMDGGTVTSADFAECQGITIREEIAKSMAQGLVTAQNQDGEWNHDALTIAQTAVEYADALLAELERTK